MTAKRGTPEDQAFEKVFLENYGKIDKHFFAKVAGVTYRNVDGVSREDLIARCATCDPIKLLREPDNSFDSDAVQVLNQSCQMLGYLHKETAEQIAREADDLGRIWQAVVRKVTEGAKGIPPGLVICLYRFSEEFVKENAAKTLRERGGEVTPEAVDLLASMMTAQFMGSPKKGV